MNMSTLPTYRYEGLPHPDRQIRVLKYTGLSGSVLTFEICVLDLRFIDGLHGRAHPKLDPNDPELAYHGQQSPYVALSYVWGPTTKSHIIMIAGYELSVTESCHTVLAEAIALESHPSTLYLYCVDQICIQQGYLAEKRQQVAVMGQIFRKAATVLCSLGHPGEDSAIAFSLAQSLADEERKVRKQPGFDQIQYAYIREEMWSSPVWQKYVGRGARADEIHSLLETFENREYWKRLWIVQEVCLGYDPILLCGNQAMEFAQITRVDIFHRWLARANKLDYENNPMIEVRDFRHIVSWRSGGEELSIFLLHFQDWHCRDPRDRVYGALHLLGWPETLGPINPDYSISNFQLALRLIPYILADNVSQELDIQSIVGRALELTEEERRIFREQLNRQGAQFAKHGLLERPTRQAKL